MTTVNSSQTRLAYVAESTYGTTPATPTMQIMRVTGEGLKPALSYITSDEIRADRNVPDLTLVGSEAGGNIDFELSYGSMDDVLESLMYSTWSTNVLKNGVTQKSFTIEKTFEAGTTDQYHRFTGSIVNTLSLKMEAKKAITGSFGFVSKGMSSAQAIISGATYTAVNSNPVINAATNFTSLTMTGISSPKLMSLNIDISNQLKQQPVIGSIDSNAITAGTFIVTGSFDAYFETNDMYDSYLNDTSTNLSFTIGGAGSKNYAFSMGKVKFSDGEILAGAANQDVMARMKFQALYYASDAATLKITRTA